MFNTIAEVRAANKAAGSPWFDPETRKFFNSKVESRLYQHSYFITSERYNSSYPKLYTVRKAKPSGHIMTISVFQEFDSLDEARVWLRQLVRS